MYPHVYPSPFGEWCHGNCTGWSGWHIIIFFESASDCQLSYNLKHAKKATTSALQLEPQSLTTYLSQWWNLKVLWNVHMMHPQAWRHSQASAETSTSIHPVVLAEHVKPNLEWGLLSIKVGRGSCSPHLKIRNNHSLSSTYHPVCLISCVFKLLKRMFSSSPVWILENWGLVSDYQCGFWQPFLSRPPRNHGGTSKASLLN
jgi:hypothetical protein